jgi:hypothetical protein
MLNNEYDFATGELIQQQSNQILDSEEVKLKLESSNMRFIGSNISQEEESKSP